MLNIKSFNARLHIIAVSCIVLLTQQIAHALPMKAFYGKYHFSASETSGYFNDKPLQDYQGTLTIKPISPSQKAYNEEANAIVIVAGGMFYSAKVKVRHGNMMSLHYTNKKGQQVVAFCSGIQSTAFISKCEGSLNGNMDTTTLFSLKKN